MPSLSQQTFNTMLRDHIVPALRGEGMKGSGREYALPSEVVWALLGIQSSTSSGPAGIKFTVNLKVVRKDVWDAARAARPYIGPKPKANVGAPLSEWWTRIGNLMPDGNDHWWFLPVDAAPEVQAAEVLEAILIHGLPAMREEVDRQLNARFTDPFTVLS